MGTSGSALGTTEPLISVITVCLNEAPERINKTFSSIVSQTYERIEFIVIDGGSRQASLAAIQEFSDYTRIFISEPDRGIYDAMNKGTRLSKGDFVIYMQVGDWFLATNTLADMVEFIVSNSHYDYYYGDLVRLIDDRKEFAPMPQAFGKFYMYERTICHQTILTRRELFEQVGDFDISYCIAADRDWLLRGMLAGAQGTHTGVTVCGWEIGGNAADWRRERRELSVIRKRYFSRPERVIFGLGWNVLKVINRFCTRSFAVPVAWQHSKVR